MPHEISRDGHTVQVDYETYEKWLRAIDTHAELKAENAKLRKVLVMCEGHLDGCSHGVLDDLHDAVQECMLLIKESEE